MYLKIVLLFTETINNTGYGWFLDNIVNNNYGKWPLVVGSENFEATKFDPAIVAGNILIIVKLTPYTNIQNSNDIFVFYYIILIKFLCYLYQA
jgi:hypothetical protein